MADWTDLPWMTADPAVLLEAARAADPAEDADVHLLLDEQGYTLDATGGTEHRIRLVYVILTKEGADSWGMTSDTWAPWREDRPVVDARVIAPDGTVHRLDQRNVAESIEPSADPAILSDVHALRVPLPALVPGSVVEEIIVEHARTPLVPEGGLTRTVLTRQGVVDRTKVRVEVAEGQPFTWTLESSGIEPVETRKQGSRVLTIDLARREFEARYEPDVPPDVRPAALYVSTAKSWNVLARSYAAIIEEQLATVDLAARAKAARGSATGRDAIVAALLADVRSIRYTGVEFGRQAIVPSLPADVLKRGYGDCKDKATLLVGMLRASGIPADVALLRAGFGPDIAPLPGLDDFNHAIVYVPGPTPLWIDPTSDWTPAGELPISDQGRLALVASPSTKAPTLTPTSPSSANVAHILREVRLAPSGPASVTETITRTGWIAEAARPSLGGATREDLGTFFEGRGREVYTAEAWSPPTTSDRADLGKPFTTTFAMSKARYGYTAPEDAIAQLATTQVFGWMPDWVFTAPAAGEEPRREDALLARHAAHIEQRILVPAPYVAATLPDPISGGVGPVTWSVTYDARPGEVVAHVRFDTGDGRVPAAKVDELRTELAALASAPPIWIQFEHAGARAFHDGHVAQAMGIYREQLKATPEDALAIDGWGRLLLNVGFGAAGREQALAAFARAPDDAHVAANAANAHMYDDAGVYLGRGWDREKALEIAARGLEANPADGRLLAIQAVCSATAASDGESVSAADMDRAIAALQTRKEKVDGALDGDLALYLVRTARWADLKALVPTLPEGALRNRYAVLLATMQGDADAGLKAASRLPATAEERALALSEAADLLIRVRRYPEASQLIEAGASASANPAAAHERARRVATIVPWETRKLSPDDPAALPMRLTIGALTTDDISDLFAKEAFPPERAAEGARTFDAEFTRAFAAQQASGFGIDGMLDVVGGTEVVTAGSPATGWRIQAKAQDGSVSYTLYAVREKGAVRLRVPGIEWPEIGAEALARVERGDLEGATQWLDWAKEAWRETPSADPFATQPFTSRWPGGGDTRSARIAAALLMWGDERRAPQALAVLEQERAASTDPAEQLQLDRAIAGAQGILGRFTDSAATVARLREARPDAVVPIYALALATHHAGDTATALKVVREGLGRFPRDVTLQRAELTLLVDSADSAARLAAAERLVANPEATSTDLNNAAWYCRDHPARALEWSQRANARSRYGQHTDMHTLAVLLLDAGRPDEAWEVLAQAMKDPAGATAARDPWQHVRGRLAEAWGLPAIAADLYATVPAPPDGAAASDYRVDARTRRAALTAR